MSSTVLPSLSSARSFLAFQQCFPSLQAIASNRLAALVYGVDCLSRARGGARKDLCGDCGGLVIEGDFDSDGAGECRRRGDAGCAESLCCLFDGPGFDVDSWSCVCATGGGDGGEDGHCGWIREDVGTEREVEDSGSWRIEQRAVVALGLCIYVRVDKEQGGRRLPRLVDGR